MNYTVKNYFKFSIKSSKIEKKEQEKENEKA